MIDQICYRQLKFLTWKILGALTRDASAEERVAENIPADIRGAKPDTILITWKQNSILRWQLSILGIFTALWENSSLTRA